MIEISQWLEWKDQNPNVAKVVKKLASLYKCCAALVPQKNASWLLNPSSTHIHLQRHANTWGKQRWQWCIATGCRCRRQDRDWTSHGWLGQRRRREPREIEGGSLQYLVLWVLLYFLLLSSIPFTSVVNGTHLLPSLFCTLLLPHDAQDLH